MTLLQIISNILRGFVRANSVAKKSIHHRLRHPQLDNSSIRYLNLRKLDLRVPPGLASIEQEWSDGREVMVNIIPDPSLIARNRQIRSSPKSTSMSRSRLEFHKFLGSALASLVQAEEIAARATVKLLSEMAVDDKNGNLRADSSYNYHLGKLRTVTFEYLGVDGEGKTVKRELQIPLISLITVPVLQIRDAKLDFEIEVFQDNRSLLRSKKGEFEPKGEVFSDLPNKKFLLEESIPCLMVTVPASQSNRDERKQESGEPSPMNDLPDEGWESDFGAGEDFTYQSFRMGVSITVERSAMPQGMRDLLNMTDRQINLNTTTFKENGTSSESKK